MAIVHMKSWDGYRTDEILGWLSYLGYFHFLVRPFMDHLEEKKDDIFAE